MKDYYTFSCNCQDGSTVQYCIEDGIKVVYQWKADGTKRKAAYEDGKWITI